MTASRPCRTVKHSDAQGQPCLTKMSSSDLTQRKPKMRSFRGFSVFLTAFGGEDWWHCHKGVVWHQPTVGSGQAKGTKIVREKRVFLFIRLPFAPQVFSTGRPWGQAIWICGPKNLLGLSRIRLVRVCVSRGQSAAGLRYPSFPVHVICMCDSIFQQLTAIWRGPQRGALPGVVRV